MMSKSTELARVTAIVFYLSELQRLNLVTPSIGMSHPADVLDKEQLIRHNSYRKIQQLRICTLQKKIAALKMQGSLICWKTFMFNKKRLQHKIQYLVQKHKPKYTQQKDPITREREKKVKNKKSRERYRARLIKKKIKAYNDKPEQRTVVNLSSIKLSMSEIIALELGDGFVLTPNNHDKEEEMLVLEGMRFVDRIGKADARIEQENNQTKNEDETNKISKHQNKNLVDVESSAASNISTNGDTFSRSSAIPVCLQYSQPKERNLTQNVTKVLKKEFDQLNSNIISNIKSKQKKRFNLPKTIKDSLFKIKKMVKDKVLDIRKVDKGQTILVIDYNQRIEAERSSISTIATYCEEQASNWEDNKTFVEEIMKKLFTYKFITGDELAAVTGLLAGGKNGKLKMKDGTVKYTRAIDSNELFVKQKTPYIYPLFKLHKVPIEIALNIQPCNVANDIPSRLVVGMKACQMSRVQAWLEHFLTPLSKNYCSFEYIKDSTDFLIELEDIRRQSTLEKWNWSLLTIFTIDVKALYPSIKFDHLSKALVDCFVVCTDWSDIIIETLVELILYTLQNQQILWNGHYYMFNQGLITGGKHSVPIANILLSYILLNKLRSDRDFNEMFQNNLCIWKRFVDDGSGIIKGGIEAFMHFFTCLNEHFNKFDLELTCDTDTHHIAISNNQTTVTEKELKSVNFLDIELFKTDDNIETREYRKETSSISYLKYSSAHPRHTFAGIVKSQLYRIRRLCSRQVDYEQSVADLKIRCLNSNYPLRMVDSILEGSLALERVLVKPVLEVQKTQAHELRLVVLAGTRYVAEFSDFARRMNSILNSSSIKVTVVKSTSLSISQVLYNNSNPPIVHPCVSINCFICNNSMNKHNGSVTSTTSNKSYRINTHLSCDNGGIYVTTGGCRGQYSGKTTTPYSNRTLEHFRKSKGSSVYQHNQNCVECANPQDCSIAFVENYQDRGKYSLSEREFLWNYRIKGTINVHKTLKS